MGTVKIHRYEGKNATVSWSGKHCIHIGECGRAKGELFVAGRKPWCQPDVSSNEEVREVVLRCPTGALSVHFADGEESETADPINTVNVAYNGPLFVRGDLSIDDAAENVPGLRYRAALCRCGQSKNKPFCDNSHEDAEFRDYGAVGETGSSQDEQGGQLSVSPIKDGPLKLTGNFTIVSGGGREAWHGSKAFLCRCGASNNKPFCDGQHKKVGFESD